MATVISLLIPGPTADAGSTQLRSSNGSYLIRSVSFAGSVYVSHSSSATWTSTLTAPSSSISCPPSNRCVLGLLLARGGG